MEIRDHFPAGNVSLIVHRSTAAEVMSVVAGEGAVDIKVPAPGYVT
jgi:hypothetical protein